jgi:hypothetical protein
MQRERPRSLRSGSCQWNGAVGKLMSPAGARAEQCRYLARSEPVGDQGCAASGERSASVGSVRLGDFQSQNLAKADRRDALSYLGGRARSGSRLSRQFVTVGVSRASCAGASLGGEHRSSVRQRMEQAQSWRVSHRARAEQGRCLSGCRGTRVGSVRPRGKSGKRESGKRKRPASRPSSSRLAWLERVTRLRSLTAAMTKTRSVSDEQLHADIAR